MIEPESDNLTGKSFQFFNANGDYFGEIRLEADGRLFGYRNANEAMWSFEDGSLLLLDQAGSCTTRFSMRSVLPDGLECWKGQCLVAEPPVENILVEWRSAARVTDELIREIYSGLTPIIASQTEADSNYPHTNLPNDLIAHVLEFAQPKFWLEIGSMIGGSAIRTADEIKRKGLDTSVVCVDPFTGDVNAWAWERARKLAGEWPFLNLDNGRPRIFDRFVANVHAAGHADTIVPLSVSSIVGLRLIKRLFNERRISALPDVIFLDSAHEADETLLEVQHCWSLLKRGGILIGDDWRWPAVRRDVLKFACSAELRSPLSEKFKATRDSLEDFEGIFVEGNIWLAIKF